MVGAKLVPHSIQMSFKMLRIWAAQSLFFVLLQITSYYMYTISHTKMWLITSSDTCKLRQNFEQQQEKNLQSLQRWQPKEDDLQD